jgi:hypothetical protein
MVSSRSNFDSHHDKRKNFCTTDKLNFLLLQTNTFERLKSNSVEHTMASAPDQSILEALRGCVVESTKQPTPRLVKIYISSTKQGKWGEQVVMKQHELNCLERGEKFDRSKCCDKKNCNFFFSPPCIIRIQRGTKSVTRSHRTRIAIDLRWQANWGLCQSNRHSASLDNLPFHQQIELVDMHFGTGLSHTTIDLDPYVLYDHLSEIRACYRASRSIFFIVSKRFALTGQTKILLFIIHPNSH